MVVMEQGLCRKEAERVSNNGYPVVSVGDGRYLVSRVMAKLITGEKPSKTIDHRDRDPLNNRRSNLRLATQLEQVWYTQLRKDNTSGFRGVSRLGAAQMTKGGVSHHLGAYSTPEEAAAAYELEARRDHGEFYCEPAYAASLKAVTPKRRLWRGVKRPVYWSRLGKRWEAGLAGADIFSACFQRPKRPTRPTWKPRRGFIRFNQFHARPVFPKLPDWLNFGPGGGA